MILLSEGKSWPITPACSMASSWLAMAFISVAAPAERSLCAFMREEMGQKKGAARLENGKALKLKDKNTINV